ncbi:hypothetical protein V8E55_011664 [Tylopilus felleus]
MQRKYRVVGRSIGELDARDPSLINLPLPVNSIPVLGPLASPLVGNGAGGGSQPSTSPNPQPAPASTAGSGNGGGTGGGNGGENGGGDGGGNGGGNTPTPVPTPTSGGGSPAPESIIPSPGPPNPAPGTQPSTSSAKNASGGGSVPSPSSPGGGGDFLIGGGQTVPVNVASTPAALGTGFSSQYSLGSGSNTVGAVASSPTISTAAALSYGKQLSVGAVAGITVVCLFFLLALVLLVVRRRLIAHRLELRKQWWFSRNFSGHSFTSRSARSPAGSNGEAPASRLSARSSFATNFDQGLMLRIDSPSLGLIPEFPPTAEVRERNSVLISTGGAVARRESMNSMLSNGSDPDAQYLTLSTGQNNLEPSTPMSVRPFSPSESFAFPKPPAPPSSTVNSFFLAGSPAPASPQSSATTLVHLSTPPRVFMTDLPLVSAPVSLNPQNSTPSITLSPFIATANLSVDPFMDPPKPEFLGVEVIRRPFTPSLNDEMAVLPGDRVRIIRVFDDGWAFVDKVAGTGGERHERGLIPVDCFRDVDQALPSFLAENRVSYGSHNVMGTAM